MSLINQVLVELEKRHASGTERATLPDHIRALPESGDEHRLLWYAAAALGVVALAALGWFALSGFGLARPAVAPPRAAADPEPVIESVVAASAAAVTDVTPSGDTTDARSGHAAPAGRMSFELSGTAAPAPSERKAIASERPGSPIPAARVLARAEEAGGTARETQPLPAAAASRPPRDGSTPPAASAPTKPAAMPREEIQKHVHQPSERELSDAEYRKAAVHLNQGRLQEAQDEFRAALKLYPQHHGARQALVALLLAARNRAEAEAMLREGIKLAPEQIGFAMTLARLQVDNGENAAAIATLNGGLAYAQGSPDYVAFLAALLQREGRHADAIDRFQAALRAKPDAGVWWLGLAMSLQAVNRAAEAQDAYRRAKASNSLSPELAAFADQRLQQLH